MEGTVKERLIQYLAYKKIGRNKFETMAGISLGYITNLRKSPGAGHLVKILTAAPDLSRSWLLTGEGPMLTTPIVEAELVNEEQPEYFTDNTHGNHYYKGNDGQLFIDAPLVPYCALGCPPDEYAELAKSADHETERFKVDRVGHGRYFSFLVDGDSMDDGTRQSFERGDIVLVRELDKEDWLPSLHIKQWKFWVVCWQNCVRLKQIVSQEGNIITLHSLNPSPEYTDFSLDLNDVQRLFNVIKKKPKTVEF